MSECHFWWRAGDTQWCDMLGDACHCYGWDESCDLKKGKNRQPQARLVAQIRHSGVQRGQKRLRRTA